MQRLKGFIEANRSFMDLYYEEPMPLWQVGRTLRLMSPTAAKVLYIMSKQFGYHNAAKMLRNGHADHESCRWLRPFCYKCRIRYVAPSFYNGRNTEKIAQYLARRIEEGYFSPQQLNQIGAPSCNN